MKKILVLMMALLATTSCGLIDSKNPKKMSLDEFDNDPAANYVAGSIPENFGEGKSLYADHSSLYTPAPKMIVETWMNGEPDMKGKFVIVNYWNSWCPPSRRSLKLMDALQRAYPEDLVCIAICDEEEEVLQKFLDSRPDYKVFFGIDMEARNKQVLGVTGVPHFTVLEPSDERVIVWEGFPLNMGHPFTVELMGKFINAYKKSQAQ